MKKILFIPILLLVAIAGYAEVTHLKIVPMTGEEMTSSLGQIGKIVLGSEQMCLYGQDGSELGCTPFSEIGKIVFSEDGETSLNDVEATVRIILDLAQEKLFVRGIEGQQTVRVFSVTGQLLHSTVAMDGEANVPVAGLQNGTYLLQVGAQVVKFIKE